MIDRLDHVNLVVDDLEAMIAFYRDVLGLRLAKRVSISGPWIEAVTGLRDAAADVAILEAGRGAGVELICYRAPQGVRPPGIGEPNTKGIRHVAFRADDLGAVAASLRSAGIHLLSEVQQVPASQVEFADRHKRIVYCRDPEGNLLELCDYVGTA